MRCRGLVGSLAVFVSLGCGVSAQPRAEPPPDAFGMAEALYSRSDYAGAVLAYEEHMSVRPDDPRNDRVLLRLGVIYLLYGAPDRDPERGEQSLRELANRFPSSPLREAADYVLALRQEVAALRQEVAALGSESERRRQEVLTLESQIEALKRIDLESGDPPR